MMVGISDLIISIDLHAVMVLVLCSYNAELQLLNIYFYCIKLSVKLINYWLLISKYSMLRPGIGVSNTLVLVSPIPN